MIASFFFIIISIIYNVIISYVFFNKTHIKSAEIKIFGYLLITNLIGLFLELYNKFSIAYIGLGHDITMITCKIYLYYYIVYIILFFNYFLAISFSYKSYKRFSKYFYFFSLLALIGSAYLIYMLPVEVNSDVSIYLSGLAVETVFSLMSIFLILIILIYIFRYRHIDKNKYIACLSFIILSGLVGLIQKYFPFITLTTAVQTIVLYIMYNTIENPDAKMLEKVKLGKLLIEKNNNNNKETLNTISQDIRNPLNSIIGFSEDIKKYEKKIPTEVLENVNYILESSNAILDVVDNISEIKDAELTDLELSNRSYSLKKEINKIKNKYKNILKNENINFIINMDNSIPEKLYGDKTFINEILNNILSMSLNNTLKGEIELYVKCDIFNNKCNLLFIIKDTGIGYKKEELLELKNIGTDDNIKIDEKNILFAITKNMVKIMDGKIEIDSKYKNGTIVTVIIPQDLDNNIQTINEIHTISGDCSNKKILVVDDNELNIKVLKRALEELKIKIDSASSGEEAISVLSKSNYDLVLMDIMMPNLSGVETLNKLKENKAFNTKVVALTADAASKAKEKYLKLGFVEYISKPFSKTNIQDKIIKILK